MTQDICLSRRCRKQSKGARLVYYERQNYLKRPMIFVYPHYKIYRIEIDCDSAYPQHFTQGDVDELLRLAHEYWDNVKMGRDTMLFAGGQHYMYFSRFTEDIALKVARRAIELWDMKDGIYRVTEVSHLVQ